MRNQPVSPQILLCSFSLAELAFELEGSLPKLIDRPMSSPVAVRSSPFEPRCDLLSTRPLSTRGQLCPPPNVSSEIPTRQSFIKNADPFLLFGSHPALRNSMSKRFRLKGLQEPGPRIRCTFIANPMICCVEWVV